MLRATDHPIKPPEGFDKWNRSMRGAYMKGARAFLSGETLGDCPYRDHRTDSGRLSWSRAYIRAWSDGFVDAEKQKGCEV